MDQFLIVIFQLIVLLFSVMVHEVSHGALALKLGDETAKKAGRLTLNPLKHLDPIGSFILPLSLFLFTGGRMIFGWAKPVPYDPRNLKNPRIGAGIIGAAGPASNFVLAIVFGLIVRFLLPYQTTPNIEALTGLFSIVVFINLLLGVFNLLPVPPLDGSSILFALLPERWQRIRHILLIYGFWILLFVIFFLFQYLIPVIALLFRLITGVSP
jgi:Zn-dependent protease